LFTRTPEELAPKSYGKNALRKAPNLPKSKRVSGALRVVLPAVNDDSNVSGPDLGPLELGKPEPHYGPRWITWKLFCR
jgi:hypothetical protein